MYPETTVATRGPQSRGALTMRRPVAHTACMQDAAADDDGLVFDLDYLEANCLRLINTKEEAKEEGGGTGTQ